MSALIDAAAKSAYEECLASYAEMHPLSPEFEAMVKESLWDGLSESMKDHWRRIIIASLKAVREPNQKMRECGRVAGWHGGIEGFNEGEEDAAASLWERMIDVLLKEV